MNDVAVSNLNARIEWLERQNLILKIIGLVVVFVFVLAFVIPKTNANDSEVAAQRFTLLSPDGKKCGYLGYDQETKNPRLSLGECGGSQEMIGLIIEKDSSSLVLDVFGFPRALLQTNRRQGNAILGLYGQPVSDGASGAAYMSSGNNQSAPQLFLDGREKGRLDLFINSKDYFRFSDDKAKTRFVINKPQNDNVALRFYDKTGANEIYRVTPKLSKSK